ncbi:hypothetical protein DXG01_011933 [Tephrocybe rancida]|nr:hypothetical protein DXG01_011933 [Tephrocybe rancida]
MPRFVTLFVSLLVTLSSGTGYAFSAYAPQLSSRLQITHMQLNIIGVAKNIGAYSTAPVLGRIIDRRGPRILLALAFVMHLGGYSGMKSIFDSGVPGTSSSISTLTFCTLVLCSYMTGVGGNAALTSAINTVAKTFPDKARATATGLVISGFGLSAFLFSTIFSVKFAGDPSAFLRFLSFGTSIPMIVGFFFVRPIPLPPSENTETGKRGSCIQSISNDEHDALLAMRDNVPVYGTSPTDTACSAPVQLSRRDALIQGRPPNVYGRLVHYNHEAIVDGFPSVAGTGLTYIDNVGSMSQALYRKAADVYNPIDAARWQAEQVAWISLLNFSGRIFIGLVSDYTKNHFGFPRSYSLVLASSLSFLSQVMVALVVDDVKHLWIASAMLGLAHGSVYSLFPNVCLDWFGMPHFSENWGYLFASPIVPGNLFVMAFGRILDAHDKPLVNLATLSTSVAKTCMLGRECYVDALYLTMSACFLSLLLSIWAAWRDQNMWRGEMEKHSSF